MLENIVSLIHSNYVHNSVWINLDFVRVVVVHKMSMVKMILQASGFALLYARISSRLV